MSITVEYASFLIRMWREQSREKESVADWKIQVEHIQSGEQRRLSTFDEMVLYLRQVIEKSEMLPSSYPFALHEALLADADNQRQVQGKMAAGDRENEREEQVLGEDEKSD